MRDSCPCGIGRVLNTVRAARHLPPDAVIENLFAAVREVAQGEPNDDRTTIVVKFPETS